MDVFEFMSSAKNTDMNNVYLRYLDYIEKFINYFYEKADGLIEKCETPSYLRWKGR